MMKPAKLNFKILGQGKPIILLHGLFGMLDNLLTLAKSLEIAGYMVILVDQRDHGRSEHTHDFNYKLLADDLLHFMEENWIHETILIGHSMGGKTGLQFITDHESMVSKFVVIDIGLKRYKGGHQDVFNALFAVDLDHIQSRNKVEEVLIKKLNDIGTVQFLMKNLTRKKEGGFEWKVNLELIYKEYHNILDAIQFNHPVDTDVLFINGSKSTYITEDDKPHIKAVLPNASFVTIADAGHWIHVDQPNELFNHIIDFISE